MLNSGPFFLTLNREIIKQLLSSLFDNKSLLGINMFLTMFYIIMCKFDRVVNGGPRL